MTTVFEQEIRSQGDVLRRRALAGAAQAQLVSEKFADISYALVAARGSSDNAAVFFQYLAGQELGLLVSLAAPSLYGDDRQIGLHGAGVLGISQSGRTPGIIDVIHQAEAQGRPRAVITNDVESPLAQAGDAVIDLAAGLERSIASTKTFSATWQALAQVVSAMRKSPLDGLSTLGDVVDRVTEWALSSSFPLSMLNAPGGLTVVGRGTGQAVAAEISLKIREVAGIRCEAYSAADYLHGPIGAASEGSTLLLVATEEMAASVSAELLNESRQSGMSTVVVRAPGHAAFSGDEEIVLSEEMPNWCAGLAEVIVGQVLALRIGELRGRPIDSSPGLKKITLSA